MFELTGEVNFILPFMVAILASKWVADVMSKDGVYDLAQHLLGHLFLDAEHALDKVRRLDLDLDGVESWDQSDRGGPDSSS